MKRRKKAFFASEEPPDPQCGAGWTGAIRTLILLFAMMMAPLASFGGEVVQIRKAELLRSLPESPPLVTEAWQNIVLPYNENKPVNSDLVEYWVRIKFTYPQSSPLWLLFPQLRTGGTIYVNGTKLEELRGPDENTQVRWHHPQLFYIPPAYQRLGENQILIRFSSREPVTRIASPSLGPERPLRETFDRLTLVEHTSSEIASVTCLLIGTLILLVWLRRRGEILYGVFGACVLFWGLRTVIFRMAEVPMAYWTFWRFTYYFTTGGFIVGISVFMLRYCGARRPLLEKFLIVYWLVGCSLFPLLGTVGRQFMDVYWLAGLIPCTFYALVVLFRHSIKQFSFASAAISLAVLLAFFLALHDYMMQFAVFGMEPMYLLHLGIPGILLVMGYVLVDRFTDNLQRIDSNKEDLTRRVAQKEVELAKNYEKLRRLENDNATIAERQRIVQDIHDGVGSQLLTTLMTVQRGDVTQAEMVTLLKDCLDDMRLAIDSLSPSDPDLIPIIGNFRLRMTSRFDEMGMILEWTNHDMPDTFDVAPRAGLQVLRIIQEALTNVIKHAHASYVKVDMAFTKEKIQVTVSDNGIGFVMTGKPQGHGLRNMKMRAQRIGALLTLDQSLNGTRVTLSVPLSAMEPQDS